MSPADLITMLFFSLGLFFYLAGAIGLLRFPDTLSRLHALTKADNLGLGLIICGMIPQVPDLYTVGKLLLIWLTAIASSAFSCNMIAERVVMESNWNETES